MAWWKKDEPKPQAAATPSIPTAPQFRDNLLKQYRSIPPSMTEELLQQYVTIFVELYKPQTPAQAQTYFTACLTALTSFTKHLPPFCHQPPSRDALFHAHIKLAEHMTVTKGKVIDWAEDCKDAYAVFTRPFKSSTQKEALPFLDWNDTYPASYIRELSFDDMSPKEREHKREAAYADQEKHRPYVMPFNVTALYPHAAKFLPTASVVMPFDLPDQARFRHQWIIGPPDAGKTTFISAMIREDLVRVARNEASLFVMDSQNELVPDIANLDIFAPGGELHGKLIYLEPDPDYPLALNIFDTNKPRATNLSSKDKAMLESGAIWMVEFFLSALVKSEATPHQDTFLNYVIPALLAIPNATIFTFKELLEGPKVKNGPTGYDKYKQHFTKLYPDTQQWLAERMHSTELTQTRNAIRSRLDGFTARRFFHDMFMHPRNKLDLFEELQTGKVILVNTMRGLLKEATEPFGRYFIAKLLQTSEERMFLERGTRLPVFAYIDEAADYLREETNIEELLNKARKQKIALTIANQMESQMTSPIVRDALSRVGIQCRGEPGTPPRWHISLGKAEPVEVQVPNVQFQKMPRMTRQQHDQMLAEMHNRFSARPDIHYRPDPPRPSQTHQEPQQYDLEWEATLSPKMAEQGGAKAIHGLTVRIVPGTKDGTRVRLKGKGARKPDGTFGDAYITYSVVTRPDQPTLGYYDDETDAKPW